MAKGTAINKLLAPKVEAFQDDLTREDDLGRVIRAHIHIEQRLTEFLETMLFDASQIERMDPRYKQKVHLALGVGLKEDMGPPLLFLGKIRNQMAHRLDVKLDKATMDGFYATFSSDDKKVANEAYARTRKKLKGSDKPQRKIKTLPPPERFKIYAVVLQRALVIAIEEAEALVASG